ncbi:hypothetical protein ACFRCI_18625 [Streptomyces sp. NPDC056638]|uniref:hypothetical protein n=1 Tax=Streptomyces sp. NPDC056638 TaxID=3345887 RepID=UPI0036A07E1B
MDKPDATVADMQETFQELRGQLDVVRAAQPRREQALLELDQVAVDLAARMLVRHDYHQPRSVTTAAGSVEVKAPRVNDERTAPGTGERKRFSSAILPPWYG